MLFPTTPHRKVVLAVNTYLDNNLLLRFAIFRNNYIVLFETGQVQFFGVFIRQKLQRNDTHSNQIRTMNSFVRLGDDRFHTLFETKMRFQCNTSSVTRNFCQIIRRIEETRIFVQPLTRRRGPLAAQSLDEPEPYSLPTIKMTGVPSFLYI